MVGGVYCYMLGSGVCAAGQIEFDCSVFGIFMVLQGCVYLLLRKSTLQGLYYFLKADPHSPPVLVGVGAQPAAGSEGASSLFRPQGPPPPTSSVPKKNPALIPAAGKKIGKIEGREAPRKWICDFACLILIPES